MWDDDDDSSVHCLYDGGHWSWNDKVGGLVFERENVAESLESLRDGLRASTNILLFKNYIDIVEQMRFRHRYQRKPKIREEDVVTVQDLKDIVLFTAPVYIMSPMLINILHQRTTERFIRALILYCQYYLQINDKMANRMVEANAKIRSQLCDEIENKYKEDLADLRLLVAVEYSKILIGCGDMKKFHHMGPDRKRKSLSEKDSRFYETLIRVCLQIVWIGLGRRAFASLELEIQRLFKTEHFNSAAVQAHGGAGCEGGLERRAGREGGQERRAVLRGPCVRRCNRHVTKSPLMDEVFCLRPTDYRLASLGLIVNQVMSPRLQFLERAISASEHTLAKYGVNVGILGISRSKFDTMLIPLSDTINQFHSTSSVTKSVTSHKSVNSKKSEVDYCTPKLYPDLYLPPKEKKDEYLQPTFPEERCEAQPCDEVQHRRWLSKVRKIRKTGSQSQHH